jgi:UDP-N-acetylmuramoylalanine--D-glutamate ligase
MELRGKRVLVMGLGVHGGGLGVARFLAGQGAEVTVTDLRGAEQLRGPLEQLAGLPIRYVLGEHREEDFRHADLVIRNPAVPRESPFLQIARAAGAQVEMEMTLFFRLCPGPILGVTGTKGKTTTTMLAGAMVREQFPDTVIAGNMRVSALEQLPRIGPATPVVLELSSFALEGLGEAGLSPRYACVTNLAPDHLDRYRDMAAYAEAKRQIFLHQNHDGVLVLNRRDPLTAPWADHAPGQVVWCEVADGGPRTDDRRWTADDHRPTIRFGPEGLVWRAGAAAEHICEPGDVRLPGRHNLANIAAAAALAKSFGVAGPAIRRAVRDFRGVEHRLELVRELDGVRYINDTAATAPDAAIAALHSFDAPIVLIAGGADKNLPLEPFAAAILRRAKAVVLLEGSATPRLLAALDDRRRTAGDSAPSVHGPFGEFRATIRAARALAAPGDVVLLSPGCASFGMFRNEFHRGEEFRRIVNDEV